MHIVTLTTCHNRRDCTLAVLSDLHEQKLPKGVSLFHVVVDDGSTDGTTATVRERFPKVEIVEGDGHLFWAGGMRYGWEQSASKKNFDYLFVFNDDVRLHRSAITDLLETLGQSEGINERPHAIVGSFKSTDGLITTYGGRRRSSNWHPLKFAATVEPNGLPQRADTLAMNGALISADALSGVGFLSEYFIHSGADYEYGLRLIKAGGAVIVAGKHIGTCDLNTQMEPPDEFSLTLIQRLRLLADIKREPFRQRYQFYKRHGGPLWPFLWISPYLTVWFRHAWFRLARVFGSSQNRSGVL